MRILPTLIKGGAALAAAALFLSACSSTGSGTPPQNSDVLSIFWKGSEKAGIDAVVAAYQKANPDLKIVVTTADTSQYQATLRTQLSAGTAADVIFMWPANGNPASLQQIVPGGFVEDLSSHAWAQTYPDAIKNLTSLDGKVYLMAPAVTSFGPWYNDDALKAAGLAAPASWSDVLPFCAAAKAQGKVAYALGASALDNTQNVLYGLVPDLVYGADPNFDSDLASGKTTFATNDGWKTAMNDYQQMSQAGCFNDNPTGATQNDQNTLVASGKAFGMFAIGFQLSALKSLSPNTTFLIHPVSGDDDPNTNLMAVSNAGGAAVNVKALNKAGADAFVDYLAQPDTLQLYNDALAGTVPSIPTGKTSDDPNLKTITDYLAKGQTVHFLNQFWPNARIEQAMYAGVQGMLAGTEQPGDILASMDQEYQQK